MLSKRKNYIFLSSQSVITYIIILTYIQGTYCSNKTKNLFRIMRNIVYNNQIRG